MNPTFQPIYSEEAEFGIVAQLLTHPELAGDVNAQVTPQDFWKTEWKGTYETILDILMDNNPLDIIDVADKTTTRLHLLPDQAKAYKLKLMDGIAITPIHGDPIFYAQIVREKSIQRQILNVNHRIEKIISDGHSPNGEADELADLLKRLHTSKKKMTATPVNELFETVDDECEFILYPILARGCLTQLQGDPKSGKSCFSLFMALACASGRWTAGRFRYDADKPSRVVYISYEDNLRRIKRRANEYMGGLGLAVAPETLFMFGRNPDIDFATKAGEAKVRQIVEDNQADIIILDTLSYVHCAEENSKKEMQPVMAALRRLVEDYPIAVLMIHHTRKGGTNGDSAGTAQRGRGSSAIAAAPDIILDWGNRPFPNVTRCALESKETTKGIGREFDIHYDEKEDGTVRWEVLVNLLENDKKSEGKMKAMEVIESLCKSDQNGATTASLGAILPDIKPRTLALYLKELETAGKIHKTQLVGAHGARHYQLGPATVPKPSASSM